MRCEIYRMSGKRNASKKMCGKRKWWGKKGDKEMAGSKKVAKRRGIEKSRREMT